MSDQRAVLGHCGACRSPILSGIIHECAGVRAFRLAQAAGPRSALLRKNVSMSAGRYSCTGAPEPRAPSQ